MRGRSAAPVPLSLVIILLFSLLTGCSSTRGPALGDAVTLQPGWARVQHAMAEAIRDPNVWVPLAAGALLQIDDRDAKISDKLREDTPLFGSTEEARQGSDDFRDYTALAYLGSGLLAPASEQESWLITKARLLGSQRLAVEATSIVTNQLKDVSQRERPNGKSDRSFPSGHTSTAALQAQMAILNIRHLPIEPGYQQALGWGVQGMAAVTGWARVEAGAHYPADVLAGWALGHFMAHLTQAFILPDGMTLRAGTLPTERGYRVELGIRF
ncbi:MAG: phosphatase PAP2 family protein [Gammaproteobacteria bacterium]|nr:phosphatase PAP2 family protein [Gammaproteobacteria bacterium]